MRKLLPLLLCLTILLAGCAPQHSAEVYMDGYTLTVDTQNNTVTYGEDVYSYDRVSPHIMESTVTVRYPNGATYKKTFASRLMVSGGNGSYVSTDPTEPTEDNGVYTGEVDEDRYVPGLTLAKAVNRAYAQERQQEQEKAENAKNWFLAIILLVIGFISLRFPEELWWLRHWWSVANGEPSQAYLDSTRFTGVVSLVIGGIFLLMAIF